MLSSSGLTSVLYRSSVYFTLYTDLTRVHQLTYVVNSPQATSIAVNYICYKNIPFDFGFMVYILVTSTVLSITVSSQ